MRKPPEEGKIWEWRAFGRIDERLAAKVRAYPIRFGVSDLRGEDIYFISSSSDQNVKLRRYASEWVLKFKILLETRPGLFELYNESVAFTYSLPVPIDILKDAARLLEVKLPEASLKSVSLDRDQLGRALAESSPAVAETAVGKKRSQYQFENGWVELADVEFTSRNIQSISIHSPELEVAKAVLDELKPGDELEAMNYIEACRRWG